MSRLLVYVACSSSLEEFPHKGKMISPRAVAGEAVQAFKDRDHAIVYDWLETIEEEESLGKAEQGARARLVIDRIGTADSVIYLPTPNQRSFGAPLEIGVALSRGIPVIVVREYHPTFDHFFLSHYRVRFVNTVERAIELAVSLAR